MVRWLQVPYFLNGLLARMVILRQSVQALLMLTFFASVIAFVLFADVVRKIGITKSEVFTNLIPVFTALLSWAIFKEMMNSFQWIGVFVVILGVFVSQSKNKKPEDRRVKTLDEI